MKKIICILAGAALLAACEQKTEVVTPAVPTPPNPADTGQKPTDRAHAKSGLSTAETPAVSSESKTESITTTTTTEVPTATPTP